MNTRNKGALAEYRFISTAISLYLNVLTPAVEGNSINLNLANPDNKHNSYKNNWKQLLR